MSIDKKLKFYKYTLKVLTPVHIGTNEDFMPTNYVMAQEGESVSDKCDCGGKIINGECQWCGELYDNVSQTSQGNAYLYTFSPTELRTALTKIEQQELLTISKQTNLMQIKDFFRNHASQIAQKGHKKALVSNEVFSKYKSSNASNLTIEKQYTDIITHNPVILGSSLKGSLRTALINALAKGRQAENEKTIEEEFLGYNGISKDPFKNIKISDAISKTPVVTRIVNQINKSRTKGKTLDTRGNIIEIIPAGSVFEGTITYVDEGNNKVHPLKLIEACQYFYQNELKNESFYGKKCINTNFYDVMMSKTNPPNVSPIRIGKHSGAECVTVAGNRKIRVKNCKTPQKNATTMWICKDDDKQQPFGWAVLMINEVK